VSQSLSTTGRTFTNRGTRPSPVTSQDMSRQHHPVAPSVEVRPRGPPRDVPLRFSGAALVVANELGVLGDPLPVALGNRTVAEGP
jgi:hypothetical protein